MKAYITNYKKILIINSINILNISNKLKKELTSELDFGFKKGVLFSTFEESKMIIAKQVSLNFKEFQNKIGINRSEIFSMDMIKTPKNDYNLYSPSSYHIFHTDRNCEKLNKKYLNYELDSKIPSDILPRYKEWVKEHINLLESKKDEFRKKHTEYWKNIEIPKSQSYDNSGTWTLKKRQEEISSEIYNLKLKIKEIIESIPVEKQDIFKVTLKHSFLSQKKNFEEIKMEIIKEYIEDFKSIDQLKKQILHKIIGYYLLDNEKFDVDSEFLLDLNFRKCSYCEDVEKTTDKKNT